MNDIYWGVIRNQKDRHSYIEIEDLGNDKWGILLGEEEFTIKCHSKDFFEILYLALKRGHADD